MSIVGSCAVGFALVVWGAVVHQTGLWVSGLLVSGLAVAEWLSRRSKTSAEEPRCGTCRAFDHELGQSLIKAAGHFPSWFLSPDQMGHSKRAQTALPDGSPDVSAPDRTAELLEGRPHSWTQYGVCGKQNVLVNEFDKQSCHMRKS